MGGTGGTEHCRGPMGRPLVHACHITLALVTTCAASWVTLRCWSVPSSLRAPKGFLQPRPPPSCSSQSWVLRGVGPGARARLGGDGLEEIEHSVLGLNGRVSPEASGCQMMDGVDTILHPPEHRAPAPCPQPPTPIPAAAYRAPSCT